MDYYASSSSSTLGHGSGTAKLSTRLFSTESVNNDLTADVHTGTIAIVLAGVASLVATLLSCLYVLLTFGFYDVLGTNEGSDPYGTNCMNECMPCTSWRYLY
jgi:hypothetical protein